MRFRRAVRFALSAACLALFQLAPLSVQAAADTDAALTKTVADLDSALFGAYNRCDLDAFARYIAPDVEFYHDDNGLILGRDIVVERTRKYICHKVQRELIAGSLKVYPIEGYGAIEEGEHRFRPIAGGETGGVAKFVMVWKHEGDRWVLTRILSYGHIPEPTAR
jgi:hypothetical protein